MDCRDWHMLKTIAEEKSLTKTAQRLNISQPSLTYRLKRLECEFDALILNRNSRGVSFTANGEYLLKYALEMIARMEIVKKEIISSGDHISGIVRVGVSTVFAKFRLAPILKGFAKIFPAIDIALTTGSSTLELPDMLVSEKLEVIIKRGDMPWDGNKHILLEEPKGIISANPVLIDRLLSEPWIQDPSTVALGEDKLFLEWWREKFGVIADPRIISVNSIEACIQFVSQGLGWAFLPKIHVKNEKRLVFHPLAWPDGKPIMLQTVMLYKRKALEKKAAELFITYVLQECSR
ncbi:MAG: LysR family transcriptional regulator [Rectinemataceae bacterium]|nr:LysR family transcriptional regulator [Rectinemataceae bacterium]